MYKLGAKSRANLEGVHPSLVRVVEEAIKITPVDFRVTEGLRTFDRQRELVAQGASRTMNSRHLKGYAVDVVALPGNKVSWEWKYYAQIADAFKQAAKIVGVPVVWGGDWVSFKDGPHFELDRKTYP